MSLSGAVALRALVTAGALFAAPSGLAQGPSYATPAARAVVQRMLAAHGGIERWRAARTLRYDMVFFNPEAKQMGWPSPWWVSRQVVDIARRRAYHDWPLEGARLAYDGRDVWTENWKLEQMPTFESLFSFYAVALPFLTQDDGVRLGAPGKARLPGASVEYETVRMEFKAQPAPGKTARDYFLLYVDPESGRLKAFQYAIGYGAMLDAMGLPPEQALFGPMLRVHERFASADGLVFPAEMRTLPPDGSTVYGHHVVLHHSLRESFDEARMARPAGARVDTPRPERRAPSQAPAAKNE